MHILILAGGGGTRLWPLSRKDFPKQFLHFGDHKSLLQKSVERFLHSPLSETISIATNVQYAPQVKRQLEKMDCQNRVEVIVEPERRNTAPAIAYSIKYLQKKMNLSNDASFIVLPSDHLIEPEMIFTRCLGEIEPLLKENKFVLFGIQPTRPETGYGYIQRGEKDLLSSYQVLRFVEKPDAKTAQEYLDQGSYYWNSGIFAFTVTFFWKQLQQHAPEIAQILEGTLEQAEAHFAHMPDISFDYAILEKCRDLLVQPLAVNWSDIGSWDSVYEMMDKDEDSNVKVGNVIDIETKNSLIIGGKKLISTIGLEDVLIVDTDDAIFISKKGESQKVKNMVQKLVKIGKKEGESHSLKQFPWGTLQILDETSRYTILKVELFPHHSWTIPAAGTLLTLHGKIQIENKPMSQQVEEKDRVINPTDAPAELLFTCCSRFDY